MEKPMRTMKASEFKAKCLRLMDEVASTGEPITVTKNGKPITRLVPYRRRPETLFGTTRRTIETVGEIVGSIDVEWEAGG